MMDIGRLVHLLRNTSVRELMRALERDGFRLIRTTRTGGHIYEHSYPAKRRINIHYHRSSDTLDRKTLASVMRGTQWTEDDLHRLGLI